MSSRKGGLVNKKMKKYATMTDYLEAHHPKVYELFAYLGMQGALTPRRGGGLTLLVPDSKTVTDLHKVLETEDAEKASDILSGLVIQDNLGSDKEWAEKQDDIPTLLGKRVPVKNVSAGKVVLDGGAELTLDKNAKFLSRVGRKKRDPMSVWVLKGSFDPTKAPDATYKYVNQGGKKKGSAERVQGGYGATKAYLKSKPALNGYVESMIGPNGKVASWLASGAAAGQDPFACDLACVQPILASRNDNAAKLLKCVLATLGKGLSMHDWMLVFMNPSLTDDLLVGDLVKHLVENKMSPANVNVRENYLALLKADCDGGSATSTHAGRQSLDSKVQEALEVAIARTGLNVAKVIADMAKSLEQDNKFPGVADNIFDPELHAHLKKNRGLLLLLEEGHCDAHIYAGIVRDARHSNPEISRRAVRDFGSLISEFRKKYDSSVRYDRMTISDKKSTYSNGGLLDNALLHKCRELLRSWLFRFAQPDGIVGGDEDMEDMQEEMENPYSREVVNARMLHMKAINELSDEVQDGELSDRARAELMAYKSKFGKLPDL